MIMHMYYFSFALWPGLDQYATVAALLLAVVVGLFASWLGSTQSPSKGAVSQGHDVLLSFHGRNIHTGFGDFLYNGLVAAGVRVFKDDNYLTMNEEISHRLMQVIRSSKITIPIISEGYICNKWCLRELAEMKKCREAGRQLIFPIFYKVRAYEVEWQKGRVKKALASLKGIVDANSMASMSQWEEALRYVGKIRGWESERIADGHEGVLVDKVVNKVLSELQTISLCSTRPSNVINRLIKVYYNHIRKRRDGRYQVFLSFCDQDTRTGFIDYFYINLVNAGACVLRADDPSLIGKDLTEELYTAIKNCQISIPIISQHYTSSIWCLRELAQMKELGNRDRQKLMPIFYKVKPSQVQKVTDKLEEDLASHHVEGIDKDTIAKWKDALEDIATREGYDFEDTANRKEVKFVKQLINDVKRELETATSRGVQKIQNPKTPADPIWSQTENFGTEPKNYDLDYTMGTSQAPILDRSRNFSTEYGCLLGATREYGCLLGATRPPRLTRRTRALG